MSRARGTDGSLLASLPWTLLALAFSLLPHVPYLPAWITAALLACALWRYSIAVRRKPVPWREAISRRMCAMPCACPHSNCPRLLRKSVTRRSLRGGLMSRFRR